MASEITRPAENPPIGRQEPRATKKRRRDDDPIRRIAMQLLESDGLEASRAIDWYLAGSGG